MRTVDRTTVAHVVIRHAAKIMLHARLRGGVGQRNNARRHLIASWNVIDQRSNRTSKRGSLRITVVQNPLNDGDLFQITQLMSCHSIFGIDMGTDMIINRSCHRCGRLLSSQGS